MEEVMGLLIFLLLGLTTGALAALKGFHFVNQEKNWAGAQSYCRDKMTDLATIHTQDNWTRVTQMLAKSGHSAAWLGLYHDPKSWRWSLDNSSLYHTDLGNWFNFTEDNLDDVEHCAYFQHRQVFDSGCEATLSSVCYYGPNSYTTVTNRMSWRKARGYCRTSYTDLASIRDQQELDAIISVTDPDVAYWIGLSREGWRWSDQSHSSFSRWASGRPNGDGGCGAAHVAGWVNAPCGDTFPFICSAPAVHSVVLRVTLMSHGSVNVKDPRVQEALLKQMEKDLRAQGVTRPQLSLSWRKKQPKPQVSFNKTEL